MLYLTFESTKSVLRATLQTSNVYILSENNGMSKMPRLRPVEFINHTYFGIIHYDSFVVMGRKPYLQRLFIYPDYILEYGWSNRGR